MKVKFKISDERFFNNGKIILNAIPDVRDHIKKALSKEEIILTTRRKPKGKPEFDGINASSLNVALRRCLSAEAIRGETHVEKKKRSSVRLSGSVGAKKDAKKDAWKRESHCWL